VDKNVRAVFQSGFFFQTLSAWTEEYHENLQSVQPVSGNFQHRKQECQPLECDFR
jgi:hypothetical protein